MYIQSELFGLIIVFIFFFRYVDLESRDNNALVSLSITDHPMAIDVSHYDSADKVSSLEFSVMNYLYQLQCIIEPKYNIKLEVISLSRLNSHGWAQYCLANL